MNTKSPLVEEISVAINHKSRNIPRILEKWGQIANISKNIGIQLVAIAHLIKALPMNSTMQQKSPDLNPTGTPNPAITLSLPSRAVRLWNP